MSIKSYHTTQKNNRREQRPGSQLKLKVILPSDITESLSEEIFDVLVNTRFNKISIPVNTYRHYTDPNTPDDNKVITVGFIKSYDAEEKTFNIVIFNNNIEAVGKIANPAAEIVYSEYHGKLGTITKINIVETAIDDDTMQDA